MSGAGASGYLDSLLQRQSPAVVSPPSPAWPKRLRAYAVERVCALTVPTTRDEDWRITDLSPLARLPWHPTQSAPQLASADLDALSVPGAAARLVFVDGRYAQLHSFNHAGLTVADLGTDAARYGAMFEAHLGRHAGFEHDAFTALNTAFLRGGALLVAPRDTTASAPVHVLFIATQKEAASYPRCLVIAQPGATLTLVEEFVALGEDAYFTNAVTEMALGDNARVDHVRVQRESEVAFHIASCAVSLAHASRYHAVSVAFGARLSRYNLNVPLAEAGAECAIDGPAAIGGRQLADTQTRINHATPRGASRQLHKCIVGGAAHAVFNGKIMVRPGAQRTDSSQSSRNLLLSGKARVDTKPQLEIFADDVKCAHGATVGQLDTEEVFYLRSSGLSHAAARRLLIYAFGAEVIARIAVPSLRSRLEQAVLAQTALEQSGRIS